MQRDSKWRVCKRFIHLKRCKFTHIVGAFTKRKCTKRQPQKKNQIMGNVTADLCFRVKDQSPVQSISHPLHQLLPDAVLQKLFRIHLNNHRRCDLNTFPSIFWVTTIPNDGISLLMPPKAQVVLSHGLPLWSPPGLSSSSESPQWKWKCREWV